RPRYGRGSTCIYFEPSIPESTSRNIHIYGIFLILYHFYGLIDSLLVVAAVGIDSGHSVMESPRGTWIANIKNSPFGDIIGGIQFTSLNQISGHGIGFLHYQFLGSAG